MCQPANLKVTPERTLEIFIEDVSFLSSYPAIQLSIFLGGRISWTCLLTSSSFTHHAEPFASGAVLPHPLAPHPSFSPTRPPDTQHRSEVDDCDVALSRSGFGLVLFAPVADRDPQAYTSRRQAAEPFQPFQ